MSEDILDRARRWLDPGDESAEAYNGHDLMDELCGEVERLREAPVIPQAVRADLGHLLRWAGKISNDDGLGLPEALDRLYVWLASPKAVPTKEHIAHGLVGLFSIMTWDEVERNPRAKAKWLRKADAVLALLAGNVPERTEK